jgi:hypothetical protein
MATFDVKGWLGVEVISSVGKPLTVAKEIVVALDAAAQDGTFTEMDVPAKDGMLDEAAFLEFAKLMKVMLEHGVTVAKNTINPVDGTRFASWLKARFLDDRTTADKKGPVLDEKQKKEMEADMSAQGMSEWPELAFAELSLFLGRPVGRMECDGFEYNGPPTSMSGAKVAKKNGVKNFDQLLEEAFAGSEITRVDAWMQLLAQRCSTSPASPFAGRASNLYNTWWNKAKRLGNARAIAWYCIEYRMSYLGRGLPKESEPELLALAAKEASPPTSSLKDLRMTPHANSETATEVGGDSSISGSSVGPSASQISMNGQLEKILSTTSAVMDGMAALAERVAKIESGTGSETPEGRSGRRPPGSCLICHSTTHQISNCPQLPIGMKNKLKKAKEDE